MAATRHNFSVEQGADFRLALTLRDNSSTLMDLTGYTFRGQVKKAFSDDNPTMTFAFTLRDQATDTGVVDMVLAAADSSAVDIIKETTYVYDIEMVDAQSVTRRILSGNLRLTPEVTK